MLVMAGMERGYSLVVWMVIGDQLDGGKMNEGLLIGGVMSE